MILNCASIKAPFSCCCCEGEMLVDCSVYYIYQMLNQFSKDNDREDLKKFIINIYSNNPKQNNLDTPEMLDYIIDRFFPELQNLKNLKILV